MDDYTTRTGIESDEHAWTTGIVAGSLSRSFGESIMPIRNEQGEYTNEIRMKLGERVYIIAVYVERE